MCRKAGLWCVRWCGGPPLPSHLLLVLCLTPHETSRAGTCLFTLVRPASSPCLALTGSWSMFAKDLLHCVFHCAVCRTWDVGAARGFQAHMEFGETWQSAKTRFSHFVHFSLAVKPWTNYLNPWSFSFLVSKIEVKNLQTLGVGVRIGISHLTDLVRAHSLVNVLLLSNNCHFKKDSLKPLLWSSQFLFYSTSLKLFSALHYFNKYLKLRWPQYTKWYWYLFGCFFWHNCALGNGINFSNMAILSYPKPSISIKECLVLASQVPGSFYFYFLRLIYLF